MCFARTSGGTAQISAASTNSRAREVLESSERAATLACRGMRVPVPTYPHTPGIVRPGETEDRRGWGGAVRFVRLPGHRCSLAEGTRSPGLARCMQRFDPQGQEPEASAGQAEGGDVRGASRRPRDNLWQRPSWRSTGVAGGPAPLPGGVQRPHSSLGSKGTPHTSATMKPTAGPMPAARPSAMSSRAVSSRVGCGWLATPSA